MKKEDVITALLRLENVYKQAAKKRMKDNNIQEAIRMNWKKDAIAHAIEIVQILPDDNRQGSRQAGCSPKATVVGSTPTPGASEQHAKEKSKEEIQELKNYYRIKEVINIP